MKRKSQAQFFERSIQTDDGEFIALYSDKGLAGLNFPGDTAHRPPGIAESKAPPQIDSWHRTTSCALKQVLAGGEANELPVFDLSRGTDFQRRVWSALRKISAGHTRSYSEVARMIGQPEAVRAVGSACGANPIPVLVPCHRVLAAHRKIGGFSAGLDWKRKLLEREGINVSPPAKQLSLLAEE